MDFVDFRVDVCILAMKEPFIRWNLISTKKMTWFVKEKIYVKSTVTLSTSLEYDILFGRGSLDSNYISYELDLYKVQTKISYPIWNLFLSWINKIRLILS